MSSLAEPLGHYHNRTIEHRIPQGGFCYGKKFRDLAAKIPSERRAAIDLEIAKAVTEIHLRALHKAVEPCNRLPFNVASKADKKGS